MIENSINILFPENNKDTSESLLKELKEKNL